MASTATGSFWRTAGLKYLQKEFIAAKAVRSALKPTHKINQATALAERGNAGHRLRLYTKGLPAEERIAVEDLFTPIR
eukprot:CAMPEP_0181339778 /NCGR_PEP_ID=MMETSP1101-20121128/29470_1 /TAXON_ID=46948 /ORGANISM="Rhodomonas abbreviata, Strain Caron Lab Isolate" /LENGTH=77 /DNA_ID=CAMNT_0023450835 /DNA_START=46 /DNA_END=279 /DNA_ORIENTATION=+